MSGTDDVKVKIHKKYIFILLGIGSMVLLYQLIIKQRFNITFSARFFPTDMASSLIVRDQRGHEPYMTIKMKCFYCDENDDYGESWEAIAGNVPCQKGLFSNCFRNRTIKNRHETHVLALYNYCQLDRCMCNDVVDWCESDACTNVKCCLDTGIDSVAC